MNWIVELFDLVAPYVVLLCVLAMAPLAVLAAWRRVFPSAPLLYLALVPCGLALLVFFSRESILVVLIADVLVVTLAVWDLWRIPDRRAFVVERRLQQVASLKAKHRIELTIANLLNRPVSLWAKDDVPEEFSSDIDDFQLDLGPRRRAVLTYEIQPSKRGAFQMENVYLCVRSRWGMWRRYVDMPCSSTIHVYPDMKQLGEYALLARTNRLSLIGVRRTRRVGQDNEFERLRDFTRDDNYKNIDWRSTARRRRLTVKDFQANQSQRLIFMLDCGRMMTNQIGDLTLLDHALNAMLMLSYVALRQGDSVGLVCFSDRVHSYTPPRSSMAQMNRLLHASFNQSPSLVESRYDQAFLHLSAHCTRRALVILITNVIDSVNALQVQQYLCNLTGKHLPLGVLLRDHHLFDTVESQNLFRAAAAADILSWRRQVLTDMDHRGVLTLDAFPEEMTAQLVNRYLEVKARHLL
jgi:uncharacterized protein (DUF58 family)